VSARKTNDKLFALSPHWRHRRCAAAVLVACLAPCPACGSEPIVTASTGGPVDESEPPSRDATLERTPRDELLAPTVFGEPTVPVAISVATQPLGAGRFRVTVIAEPERDADELVLTVVPHRGAAVETTPDRRFGATPSGARREHTAVIRGGNATHAIGHARVSLPDGSVVTRAASRRIAGADRSIASGHPVIILPDGKQAVEVNR
jgi:hypothetical protein